MAGEEWSPGFFPLQQRVVTTCFHPHENSPVGGEVDGTGWGLGETSRLMVSSQVMREDEASTRPGWGPNQQHLGRLVAMVAGLLFQ